MVEAWLISVDVLFLMIWPVECRIFSYLLSRIYKSFEILMMKCFKMLLKMPFSTVYLESWFCALVIWCLLPSCGRACTCYPVLFTFFPLWAVFIIRYTFQHQHFVHCFSHLLFLDLRWPAWCLRPRAATVKSSTCWCLMEQKSMPKIIMDIQ